MLMFSLAELHSVIKLNVSLKTLTTLRKHWIVSWKIRSSHLVSLTVVLLVLFATAPLRASLDNLFGIVLLETFSTLSIFVKTVEGVQGHRPQAAVGEGTKPSFVPHEDFRPWPYCGQVSLLVFPSPAAQIQEDHWRDCQRPAGEMHAFKEINQVSWA